MKKLLSFVLLSAFLALFTLSCEKESETSISPKNETIPFSEQEQISENNVSKFQELLKDNSPREARELLVEDLEKTGGIVDAGISSDSITVWWKLPNGVEYCLVTETRASLTDTSGVGLAPEQSGLFLRSSKKLAGLPHNKNALVLSPYQWDWNLLGLIPLQDETSFINTTLANAGYTSTFKVNASKKDQNLTMADYESFDDYGVIAISSHGGLSSKDEVFIATGVIADEQGYNQYLQDMIDGNLVLVVYIDKWFTKDDILAFGVAPGWMQEHYPNKLENTLFYASICKGTFNNTMADALIGPGSCYFSWTESVDTKQATKTGKDLFTQLISNGHNCGEAHAQVAINGNATYSPPFWSSEPEAEFTYIGDEELRLVEEPIHIAATSAYFDDIAALLGSFGYEVSTISEADLLNAATLSQYDIIALNCAPSANAASAAANLRAFVSNGGKLYASDWAYVYIAAAFPGYINYPAYPRIGYSQTIMATIIDQDLADYLGTTEAEIVYDLGGWVVIDDVDPSTKVLMTGDVGTSSANGPAPVSMERSTQPRLAGAYDVSSVRVLAASFAYGNGNVIYTTFHNEAQVGETARHILEYFTILE
jgi:hypothetical protein